MSIEELFRNRVSETHGAQVLQLVATLPNRRSEPTSGDISGKFDFWFDGGAGRNITGWNEYDLVDGTRVTVETVPMLSMTIHSRARVAGFTGTWSHGPIRNAARSWEATAFSVRISSSKGRVSWKRPEMFPACDAKRAQATG
jgi:hypothetical protein